jgi:hypothetical protein
VRIDCAKVGAVSQTTIAGGRDVVDHAFNRLLLLFGLCCLMTFATMLGYRFATRKMRG